MHQLVVRTLDRAVTSNTSSGENLRLPSRVRLAFEQQLKQRTRKKSPKRFETVFDQDIDSYFAYVRESINSSFTSDGVEKWFSLVGIDVITWHYKTRHSTYAAAESTEWFSGQVRFGRRLSRRKNLEPFPGRKSPYIAIFGHEQIREQRHMGGPICIILNGKENVQESSIEAWKARALFVPSDVTTILKRFPEHSGNKNPLSHNNLLRVRKRNRQWLRELTGWMNRVSVARVSELEALNNLMASLKVTFKLLRDRNYGNLPRSTFLCPAYVAGEEVGGMAFACRGIIPREAALIGDAISGSLLSYLRLREDALAHNLIEEKNLLDQARHFFIHRLIHDFRHPMDSLQSTVADLEKSLRTIGSQIFRVSDMLDDTIMAVDGRDPNKILKAQRSPDRVSEFLADIRFYFRKRVEDSGKNLLVDKINASWMFNIDRGMLHEIMENLIGNAIEHGGKQIRIHVEKKAGKYLLHVKDDGPGVPKRERENIFRPFWKATKLRADNASRGRGLAISKMLAEAHKGDLRLESGRGRWNTDFVLEIPMR
jgi:signal transduction histidine kinase